MFHKKSIETNTSCSSLFIEEIIDDGWRSKYPILYSRKKKGWKGGEGGEREIKLSSMQKGAPFKKILKATKGAWKEGWQYLVGRQGQHAPACRAALHGGEGRQHKK